MNETLTFILSLLAGAVLGTVFFGGLWWTVRRSVSVENPALWFLGSGMVRMTFVLFGFYVVGGGQWRRLAAALVGFVIARLIVTWLTRLVPQVQKQSVQERSHAP